MHNWHAFHNSLCTYYFVEAKTFSKQNTGEKPDETLLQKGTCALLKFHEHGPK